MGYISDLFPLYQIQKDPDAHGALFLRKQGNGGKERGDILSRVVPINSHNGDILRHPQAHFLKSTDQSEGKFIIKSHHCGGIHFSFRENTGSQPSLSKKILIYHMGIFCHLLLKGQKSGIRCQSRIPAGYSQDIIPGVLHLSLMHPGKKGGSSNIPVLRRVGRAERDLFMSAVLQIIQRRFHHPIGIHLHDRNTVPSGRHGPGECPAFRRSFRIFFFPKHLSIRRAYHRKKVIPPVIPKVVSGKSLILHDDPVHQRISEVLKSCLPVKQHHISPVRRSVQHPLIKLHVKSVVHISAVEKDLPGSPFLQGYCHRIRRIIQLFRDFQNPLLLFLRHVTAVIQRSGNYGNRRSRPSGNVQACCRFLFHRSFSRFFRLLPFLFYTAERLCAISQYVVAVHIFHSFCREYPHPLKRKSRPAKRDGLFLCLFPAFLPEQIFL